MDWDDVESLARPKAAVDGFTRADAGILAAALAELKAGRPYRPEYVDEMETLIMNMERLHSRASAPAPSDDDFPF